MNQENEERRSYGRTTIDSNKREGSYSKRAAKGTIDIIEAKCKKCHHHKIWNKPSGRYCTKCGEKQR